MTVSASRQVYRDREHEAQLLAFYKNSDAETREKLVRDGIVVLRGSKIITTPRDFAGHTEEDTENRAEAAESAQIPELAQSQEVPQDIVRRLVAAHLRVMVAELLGAKNKALAIETLSFATGLIYEGDTESDIARRYGVTRSAVCKLVKFWQKLFNLPPRASGRKLTTCRKYVQRANRVHLRNDGQFR